MASLSATDLVALRARLASLPREVLVDVLGTAIAPSTGDDAPAPDGSKVLRVPGPGGRVLSFRLSADDLAL